MACLLSFLAFSSKGLVEGPLLTPSKRRRMRAAGVRRLLWNRTRWSTLDEEEQDELAALRGIVKQELLPLKEDIAGLQHRAVAREDVQKRGSEELVGEIRKQEDVDEGFQQSSLRDAVKLEVEQAMHAAKGALMKEFGVTFAQVLREQGFACVKEVNQMQSEVKSRMDVLDGRLQACESNKENAREGLRRRFRRMESALHDLELRVADLETICGEAEGLCGSEAVVGEGVGQLDGDRDCYLFEGAYVKVKRSVSRLELIGQMGRLREWHEERGLWTVRLRSEELVLLKEEDLEVLDLHG